MTKTRRGRPKTRNASDNKVDSELESQLKTQEDMISKKENVKFLAVLSGKKSQKESSKSYPA